MKITTQKGKVERATTLQASWVSDRTSTCPEQRQQFKPQDNGIHNQLVNVSQSRAQCTGACADILRPE